MKDVLIISGPTATGKTGLSINIAKKFSNIEIINFDSLLFYKELNIGTAKPTKEEMDGIVHHLIGISSISKDYNAARFLEDALPIINKIHSKNKIPLLVGGSGFYIRALIKGMYKNISLSKAEQDKLQKKYEENGIDYFIDFLEKNDPKSLENLHKNDHYRLMRATEFFMASGEKISNRKSDFDQDNPYDFTKNIHPNWNIQHMYLDIPKEDHFHYIEKRAKKMIDDGLIKEVQKILSNGYTGKEKPLRSIGYKETIDFLSGKINSKEALIERISISTRQLAKAQRTFFKKVTPKSTFNLLKNKDDALRFFKQNETYTS